MAWKKHPGAARLWGQVVGRKPIVMLVCGRDGRHFRALITDQTYIGEILARLEGRRTGSEGGVDLEDEGTPSKFSKTNLERGSGDD